MRVIVRAALSLLVMGSLSALPARAQVAARLRPRSGLWMDAGAGYGRLRLTCQGCNIGGIDGAVFTVTAGGSPSRYVHLGLEGQIWTGIDAGRKEQLEPNEAAAELDRLHELISDDPALRLTLEWVVEREDGP